MFRLIGFLLGCVISLTAVYLVIGTPDVHWSGFESDQARFEAALEKVKDKLPDAARNEGGDADEDEGDDVVAVAGQASPPSDPPQPDGSTVFGPAALPFGDTTDAAARDPPQTAAPAMVADAVGDAERRWQDIWAPFRSEIAARGFVARLEDVTGLDYRITKVKAGVYQVGVAYDSDSDRIAHIAEISAATGLEFSQ